jgi:hypothetical protein
MYYVLLFKFGRNAAKTTLLMFVSLTRLKVISTSNEVKEARTVKDSFKQQIAMKLNAST